VTILARAVDGDGRRVELTAERWAHTLEEHPELASFRDAVLAAVREPDFVRMGRQSNERWMFLRGLRVGGCRSS